MSLKNKQYYKIFNRFSFEYTSSLRFETSRTDPEDDWPDRRRAAGPRAEAEAPGKLNPPKAIKKGSVFRTSFSH